MSQKTQILCFSLFCFRLAYSWLCEIRATRAFSLPRFMLRKDNLSAAIKDPSVSLSVVCVALRCVALFLLHAMSLRRPWLARSANDNQDTNDPPDLKCMRKSRYTPLSPIECIFAFLYPLVWHMDVLKEKPNFFAVDWLWDEEKRQIMVKVTRGFFSLLYRRY